MPGGKRIRLTACGLASKRKAEKPRERERQKMRMMLKILIPTETGNQTIKDGSLHNIFEATMGKLKPELLTLWQSMVIVAR